MFDRATESRLNLSRLNFNGKSRVSGVCNLEFGIAASATKLHDR